MDNSPSNADTEELDLSNADLKKSVLGVKVYAPFRVYFEGDAYSVSAVNETGPFDILPHHHNFLCMIVPCDLKVDTPTGIKTIPLNKALLHVKDDRVVVFVDV